MLETIGTVENVRPYVENCVANKKKIMGFGHRVYKVKDPVLFFQKLEDVHSKLDDLAPKYMKTIPNDLFADQPLTYRPTADGYLLYSVGINGKDEDGRWTDDEPKGDDLRVRMPVVEPRVK